VCVWYVCVCVSVVCVWQAKREVYEEVYSGL